VQASNKRGKFQYGSPSSGVNCGCLTEESGRLREKSIVGCPRGVLKSEGQGGDEEKETHLSKPLVHSTGSFGVLSITQISEEWVYKYWEKDWEGRGNAST